jgi:hypothetical protein
MNIGTQSNKLYGIKAVDDVPVNPHQEARKHTTGAAQDFHIGTETEGLKQRSM